MCILLIYLSAYWKIQNVFVVQGQNVEYDFKGGAGEASKQGVHKTGMKELEEISTEAECEDEFSDAEKKLKEKMETTPVQHSSRTAGKKFKYYSNHFISLDILY